MTPPPPTFQDASPPLGARRLNFCIQFTTLSNLQRKKSNVIIKVFYVGRGRGLIIRVLNFPTGSEFLK